jgi:hypothetical protein
MLKYGDEEGKTLSSNIINVFAANCDKEFIKVFLTVFEEEKVVLRNGLTSFLTEMIRNFGFQEKQEVCKNFFNFCKKKEQSFWLIDFWLSHDSVRNFSLQNEESLTLILKMFFEFYCKFIDDILEVYAKVREDTPERIGNLS